MDFVLFGFTFAHRLQRVLRLILFRTQKHRPKCTGPERLKNFKIRKFNSIVLELDTFRDILLHTSVNNRQETRLG
jgi:hypothetical protein